ncbi:type II secretion system F family protein [Thalassotalea crassostreae]|uniref:type II secretion system F family protein n=1 Tax=Thalassotalea crassostreae TaxID=1763536 RepID=UPI000837FA2A|nr:type II secretion system F family protein [Thalassotalea crassostreae]
MDYLLGLINSFSDNPDTVRMVVYIVAAVSGITLSIALGLLFTGAYSPIRVQLQKLQHAPTGTNDVKENLTHSLEHSLDKISFLQKTYSGDEKTKRLLIHAGFHSEHALKLYNAIKLLLILLGCAIGLSIVTMMVNLSTIMSIYLVVLAIGGSYVLPGIVLTYIANKRMLSLRKYFPDALDLLVVCCESGLGLLESFQRVAKEMEFAQPALSHEMTLVCSKVRVGFSMQEALHEFSERTGLEDIRGLNSVIVQSLRLGTGIAETLRVYSEEYRDKRLQEAEEKAAKVGVKMIFPMICCIWPSFFIVAVGPAVIRVMSVWDTAF